MAPSERTPLLGDVNPRIAGSEDDSPNGKDIHSSSTQRGSGLAAFVQKALGGDVEKRILFAGFLITLSFSFTQVP